MAQPHEILEQKSRRRPLSRLKLFPPSVPRYLIRGHEVSVYYNRRQAGTWERHQRDQIEIALMFSTGACQLGWWATSRKRQEREVRGPSVCAIAPGLPHECRLEGDTEILVLYVECSLVYRATRRKLRGIIVSETARYDVVIWLLASLLRHFCVAQLQGSPCTNSPARAGSSPGPTLPANPPRRRSVRGSSSRSADIIHTDGSPRAESRGPSPKADGKEFSASARCPILSRPPWSARCAALLHPLRPFPPT